MRSKNGRLPYVPLLLLSLALAGRAWGGPSYQLLHSFGSGNDGLTVWGGLVRDGKGNLYGTTSGGGAYGGGTVFQLVPETSGNWTEHILHSFHRDDPNGTEPSSTPIFDPEGNLYASTTTNGPAGTYGTVFKLTPGSGGWKLTLVHGFNGPHDKLGGPWAGVIMDGTGNLYGYDGWAFELSRGPSGKWTPRILHRFPAFQGDGWGGLDRPVLDQVGNLYGTTQNGGEGCGCCGGCGTAWELSPQPDGKWKEHILHSFQGTWDGLTPKGDLLSDDSGNVYGTAYGGNSGYGVIFRLSRGGNGHWKETVLYNLSGGANGENLTTGVVMDKSGSLYGTAGGGSSGCGVIWRLSPDPKGKWTYTVLHSFTCSDGDGPSADLILDDKGNLYGTTVLGGAYGGGVAFELTP